MSLLQFAAVAALAVLAVAAHYAFWSRHFAVPTGEDELVFADTADGWRLALGHWRPRGPPRTPPVLLLHGIAANRASFDLGLERWSLAAYLAGAGFECFSLDLRGHGASRRTRRGAPRRWSFDDHVQLDVPAALEAIRRVTGQRAVLWVGHSQGGMIGVAAAAVFPDRVAGLVTVGSPFFFSEQGALRQVARLGFLTGGRLNRFLARSLAPFAGHWHPPVSQVVWNERNVERPLYRRVMVNVVENISSGVLAQHASWIATDTFASRDGAVDYRAAMAHCRQPALFVAGEKDLVAPPSVVERAARVWGGPTAVARLGAPGSGTCDYGHTDLLFGVRAREEVYPVIRDWLLAHSGPVRAEPR